MANKLTLPEYNKIKNKSLCVVSFKDGKRTLTYGNISYKEAIDHVFNQTSTRRSLFDYSKFKRTRNKRFRIEAIQRSRRNLRILWKVSSGKQRKGDTTKL